MSAQYLEIVRTRFNSAYARTLEMARAPWRGKDKEADVCTMKVEFDAMHALVKNLEAEQDWVRKVLAEHGYSGPLTETSCPLREWLAEPQTDKVPVHFTEYVIDYAEKGRQVFFDEALALDEMRKACVHGDEFEFSTDRHVFEQAWSTACSLVKGGHQLGLTTLHAFKLGLAAGRVPEL
jgi:hypothetical protein